MAKFIFRLQSVLDIKIRLENQQRNVLAQARKALQEEEEKLEKLHARKADYEEEGRKLRDRTLNVEEILENGNAIIRMSEYIDEQAARVILATQKMEEERDRLVSMMQERKMYERLREKAFEEYLENEKHEEGVINDEHNSYVYSSSDAQ